MNGQIKTYFNCPLKNDKLLTTQENLFNMASAFFEKLCLTIDKIVDGIYGDVFSLM